MTIDITETSKQLFVEFARDAKNWSGTPLVGGGNVQMSEERRGNLTQLKKAQLVATFVEEGCTWLEFTDIGVQYAATLGITIYR